MTDIAYIFILVSSRACRSRESAYHPDSKSGVCGFDSHLRHHNNKQNALSNVWLAARFDFIIKYDIIYIKNKYIKRYSYAII